MEDNQFDSEVKELIEWSEQLDFDEYLNEWNQIATSAKSDDFVPNRYESQQEQLSTEASQSK